MRILLLRPPSARSLPFFSLGPARRLYPLRLGYLAAELGESGAAVGFLDSPLKGFDRHAAAGAVFTFHPDVVYAELDSHDARNQLRLLARLKELGAMRIVLGGAYAAMHAETIVTRFPAVEAVLCGEPDEALVAMVSQWHDGYGALRIPGVVSRAAKNTIPPHKWPVVENLDALPFPDRETVSLSAYQAGWLHHRPFAIVAGTRGCPRTCRFCRRGCEEGRVRYRSPAKVALEVEDLVRRHGVREVRFIDSAFNADPAWSVAVAEALLPLDVTWHCTAVAATLTHEQLRSFRRSGCRDLFFSPVCPTEESAEKLMAGDGPEAVGRAIELATREDIHVHVKVITGEGDLPSRDQAQAFASRLGKCTVTIRQLQPQLGSALAPDVPTNLVEPAENKDLRHIVGFSVGQMRFWREHVRNLIWKPRTEICAEVGSETFN